MSAKRQPVRQQRKNRKSELRIKQTQIFKDNKVRSNKT
jgi:hypothetical protein